LLGVVIALGLLLGAQSSASEIEPPVAPVVAGEQPRFVEPTPIGDLSYVPGRGLRVGDTGVRLGGYTDLVLTREEGGPATFGLEDVSFFFTWDPTPRLHVFSELEFEDVVEFDDNGNVGGPNSRFTPERVYADLRLDDQLQLRGGVFLTPVGRWNVIHAAPRVWTTSRPSSTEVFASRTTGAMVFGSFFPENGILSYSAYGQFADVPYADREPEPDAQSAGARLEYTIDDWSIGSSFRSAENHDRWEHLAGLDALWHRGRFEVMGEAFFQDGPSTPSEWGFYVQAVVQLLPRLFFVQRYEHFAPKFSRQVNLVTPALAFRPFDTGVFKAGYVIADHRTARTDPGLNFSFAVLF
jgi:hypothetical protein